MPVPALAAYRVGPGDVLDLAVPQEPRLTGKFTIDEQGSLDLELLGHLKVAGRTPDDLDRLLEEKLKVYLKKPEVHLSVAEYHSQKVYVLGAVARPGSYILAGEKTLLDEVLDAGGTTPAATGKLILMRAAPENGTRVATNANEAVPDDSTVLDLPKLLSGGALGATNVTLRNGDFILVPGVETAGGGNQIVDSGAAQVTVVGEVGHPGLFRLEPGATALAAVLAAGGVTKYAAPNRSKVVRVTGKDRKVMSLNLGDIMKNGDKKKDVVLEPGDMVIVPARLF